MEDNNKKFKCAFCGTDYDNPQDRMKCENSCWVKRQKEIERNKQEEILKEKQKRYNEIETEISKTQKMIADYSRDYGGYTRKYPNYENIPTFYDLWKLF